MKFPKELKNIKKFSQGRRSIIFTAIYKNKKVAIKTKKEGIEAKNIIDKESKFLKIFNKYKIGPKFVKKSKNLVIYEFVEGITLPEYIKIRSKKEIKLVSINILKQCRILDKLKINKLEFTRPIKHIIIDKKPVLIDFEKCYQTKFPKNVTQFCQYLIKNKIIKNNKNILRNYKKNQTEKNFKEILKLL